MENRVFCGLAPDRLYFLDFFFDEDRIYAC